MVVDYGSVPQEAARTSNGQLVAGTPYLSMELVEGHTLADQMGLLPWREIERVLKGLLDALAHAHARGVIHRDLKLSNVLFDPKTGMFKLTDFGIAHAMAVTGDPFRGVRRPTCRPSSSSAAGGTTGRGPTCTRSGAAPTRSPRETGRSPTRSPGPRAPAACRSSCPGPRSRTGSRTGSSGCASPSPTRATSSPPTPRSRCPRSARASSRTRTRSRPRRRWGSRSPTTTPRPSRSTPRSSRTSTTPRPVSGAACRASTAPAAAGAVAASTRAAPEHPAPRRRSRAVRAAPDPDDRAVEERDALWRALKSVKTTGKARVVVIHGPAGAGKTRLGEWLLERAHELGAASVTHWRTAGRAVRPTASPGCSVGSCAPAASPSARSSSGRRPRSSPPTARPIRGR